MGLQSGRLRDRVSLQRQVNITNSFGDQAKQWTTFASVWADISPLSAREFAASNESKSESMARITIRYRADVDSTVRIINGSTIYNIAGALPDPDSGKEWLTLPVSSNLNDG